MSYANIQLCILEEHCWRWVVEIGDMILSCFSKFTLNKNDTIKKLVFEVFVMIFDFGNLVNVQYLHGKSVFLFHVISN